MAVANARAVNLVAMVAMVLVAAELLVNLDFLAAGLVLPEDY